MRLRKNDPTGNYWYLCDGVSPASPVLSDGYTTFTPGISEINGSGSRFYLPDAQGNSRGLLDSNQNGTDGYNWDAWDNSVSRVGGNPTAFAWNEASGYQSDGDSGLKLLGHRYYDSRTGRFISQDPAGDGDNWYSYCDNDPMDETDPEGLWVPTPAGYGNPLGGLVGGIQAANQSFLEAYQVYIAQVNFNVHASQGYVTPTGTYQIDWMMPAWGMGGGQVVMPFTIGGDTYKRLRGPQEHGNHVHKGRPSGPRYNRDGQEVDGRERPLNRGNDVPRRLRDKFRKEFDKEFGQAPGDDAQEVAPFTRWLANRSDAELFGLSIGAAALVVGSYYITPLIPPSAPALVPLLAP
jgi:RHS repeat-associated protein